MTPERTIGRLSLYRRLLRMALGDGTDSMYSHQLAERAGTTPAQVRRDLTYVGYSGNPRRGYDVRELLESIEAFLSPAKAERVALVGIGNLGRALLAFFRGRQPKLNITAAFDRDPDKTGRVIHGCRCYPVGRLAEVLAAEGIRTAILAVPASEAQRAADLLVNAGVQGILNFAPIPLRVPVAVFVEGIDMTMALEKVAYFAANGKTRRRKL